MAQVVGSADKPTHNITVLISGSGTNLQALIDASNSDGLPNTRIIRVISDRKDAYGLKRAQNADVPTTYHGILPYRKQFPSDPGTPATDQARIAYDKDLAEIILKDHPDLVVCAGFMRILTTAFLDPLAAANTPVINLHPSLHGDLVGGHCIERAWDEFQAGKRTSTGVMVHYVIAEVDAGEPILQQAIEMEGCQSVDDLRRRIQEVEHGIIVTGTKTALATKAAVAASR